MLVRGKRDTNRRPVEPVPAILRRENLISLSALETSPGTVSHQRLQVLMLNRSNSDRS
jgi:hypothetical protein